MLKVWGRTNSINVQKVLWCCQEIGLEYERIDAGLHFGVNDTPEYSAMNPTGLVPTIEDGDFRLWESNVIVRYLSHKHSTGGLCPADIATRFDAERWMDWQTAQFWAVLRPLYIALIRTPVAQRDAAAMARAEKASEAAVRILDAARRQAFPGRGRIHDGGYSGGGDGPSLVRTRYRASGDAERDALVRPDAGKALLSADRHDAA
jgi:glutathione S-transferase